MAKKLTDYLPKEEEKTETFAIRISAETMDTLERKMRKLGVRTKQSLGEALIARFLEEQ